jgi:AcrR family transcriptional regulator
MTTTQPTQRPLRADAQRNHDRIVAAAGDAFAEHGLEASMEQIARRAEVGPATLYRRFPGKQELLRAILDARMAELEPQIAVAAQDPDPWQGLLAGMRALLDAQARNMALVQVLAQADELTTLKRELGERIFAPLTALFLRAQADAAVRGDLEAQELHVLIRMVACTAACEGPGTGATNWERYLALLTDALRTPTPTSLPPL